MIRPVGNDRGVQLKSAFQQGETAIFEGYRLSWSKAGFINVLWLFRKNPATDFHVASRDVRWFPMERPLVEGAHVNEVERMGALLHWTPPVDGHVKQRKRPRSPPATTRQAKQATSSSKSRKMPGQPTAIRTTEPVIQQHLLGQQDTALLTLYGDGFDDEYLVESDTPTPTLYDVREVANVAKLVKKLEAVTWNVTPEAMQKNWFGPIKLPAGEALKEGYKTPSGLRRALDCPIYGRYWRASYLEEYQAMLDNGTWRRVGGAELKQLRNTLGTPLPVTVVLKAKTQEDPIRFKSRFCVMGNYQDKSTIGLTYAPTVHEASVTVLLVLALTYKLEIRTMDAKSAFLRGDLLQKLLVRPPPGIDLKGDLLLLERNLYGLPVAARTWWLLISRLLRQFGLIQCDYDIS